MNATTKVNHYLNEKCSNDRFLHDIPNPMKIKSSQDEQTHLPFIAIFE
jgi:hypothetical protein